MDDRAATTAALDLTVKEYLVDMLDDSTRKLYSTVALDPPNAEDGAWNKILSGIRPSAPEMLPDISVYAHNVLLDWRPKKVTPDTVAAFHFRTKEAVTDDVLYKIHATYTLALHSDFAQKRRLASLTALGMTQDEVIGTQFLLDAHDMQLMKDTVARRKDKAVLAGVAGLRKPLIKKKVSEEEVR